MQADGYQNTGCFNVYCSAFVQVDQHNFLDMAINPISVYKGIQYVSEFTIVQVIHHYFLYFFIFKLVTNLIAPVATNI